LLTVSSGNAAHATALVARLHGVSCVAVMPDNPVPAKEQAVRRLGADVVYGGQTAHDMFEWGARLVSATGRHMVHPYDDWAVIAGAAGVGVELVDDVRDLTRVLVPTSGGSLLAGLSFVIK